MSYVRNALVLAMCVTMAGCATVPTMETPKQRDTVINKPFADTWPAMTTLITQSGYFINVADKDSGLITFIMPLTKEQSKEWIMQKPPSIPIGGYYDKSKAYVTLYVKSIDEKSTKVNATTRIESVLHNMFGEPLEMYQGKSDLNSNGGVEKNIFDLIQTQVGDKNYKFMQS